MSKSLIFQVKHIFTDKTGTLTTNIMELKHFSIAGELYLERSRNKLKYVSNLNMIIDYFLVPIGSACYLRLSIDLP